jgi:hypothetical protein
MVSKGEDLVHEARGREGGRRTHFVQGGGEQLQQSGDRGREQLGAAVAVTHPQVGAVQHQVAELGVV